VTDHPETRYTTTVDGVHVAYRVFDDGPIDVLFVLGWVTHVERMWDEPNYRRFFTPLRSLARAMMFDERGVGLSDRVPEDRLSSLKVRMDARGVMDATGSERALFEDADEPELKGIPDRWRLYRLAG